MFAININGREHTTYIFDDEETAIDYAIDYIARDVSPTKLTFRVESGLRKELRDREIVRYSGSRISLSNAVYHSRPRPEIAMSETSPDISHMIEGEIWKYLDIRTFLNLTVTCRRFRLLNGPDIWIFFLKRDFDSIYSHRTDEALEVYKEAVRMADDTDYFISHYQDTQGFIRLRNRTPMISQYLTECGYQFKVDTCDISFTIPMNNKFMIKVTIALTYIDFCVSDDDNVKYVLFRVRYSGFRGCRIP